MLCFSRETLAPTEESAGWAHRAVGYDGSTREAPPVSDKGSSVGARVLREAHGSAGRLPQNDSDRPYTVLRDSAFPLGRGRIDRGSGG
jgi:hypothetical protein